MKHKYPLPAAKFDGPSPDEQRHYRAESTVQDAFRNSPHFKKMTSQVAKELKQVEAKALRGLR